MTVSDDLYVPWIIDGSYLNLMIDCGSRYNGWVETALRYLPPKTLDEYKEDLAFVSTAEMDACRLARKYCESREVIILSERILPKENAREDQLEVRYFVFAVLHEVVHVVNKHKSPKFDHLTPDENNIQEQEADQMALRWFNEHVEERQNPHLQKLTIEEIETARANNQALMEKQYAGQ